MASDSCQKVIVDCDPGIDDAQAIIMLLTQKHIQVVAITTVFGNETVEITSRNALRVLKLCKRLDIPVYKGCASPLIVDWRQTRSHDELSQFVIPDVDPVDTSCIQPEHASVALCRFVSQDPGSITLLSTAPLTNIAVALMLDSSFGHKLKNCVMMGGKYIEEENITSPNEFNWHCDPEAAHAVLAGLNKVITLLPFETCCKSALSWEWHKAVTELPNRVAQFVKMADERLNRQEVEKYFTWDQLAAACVIDPTVICKTRKLRASVELHGLETRSQMVIESNEAEGKTVNVCIVTRINQALYEKLITAAFTLL